MILQDLALFKEFIEKHTIREIYIRAYKRSVSFAKTSSSIEEFLLNIKPEEAIVGAIKKFTPNETFGYDFWMNTNDNWLIALKHGRMRKSYSNKTGLSTLDGMYKVLRENWDAPKSWLFENVDVALTRMNYIKEESQEEPEEVKTFTPKFKIGDFIKGSISGDVCKVTGIDTEHGCYLVDDDGAIDFNKEEFWNLIKEEPKEELPDVDDFSGVPEADDDLEFFDINSGARSTSTKLKKGQASLNFKHGSYKLTFNQEDTKKIKNNLYKYVRLARNKQGDIVLQLHKVEGLTETPVNITFVSRTGNKYLNAAINSKDLCTKLKTLLNLTGDYFTIKLEELFIDFDKANYKISK